MATSKGKLNVPLLVGAGVVGVLVIKNLGSSNQVVPAASAPTNPLTTAQQTLQNILSPAGSSVTPTSTNQVPTTYGINSGIKGGNGSFYTVANYQALLAANPDLGNPNLNFTDAQAQQYLANYQDLRTALPGWIGVKQPNGFVPKTLNEAAAQHWHFDGCAEQRIYLPLVPPSSASYVPPPVNTQAAQSSSSGSWVTPALKVAGSIAMALLGTEPGSDQPRLNEAEVNKLITGSAVVKEILPFFANVEPNLVHLIDTKIDVLVSEYAN
jgi:hypothetical protein